MTIKDIMTTPVKTCTSSTNLAEAAAAMIDGDCGFLPVVDDGTLAGVVTDRDMYIALATRNARASDLRVGDVARKQVWTCNPDDDLHAALATMQEHRVRRLPVLGFGGTVAGVVSMNDLLLQAGAQRPVRDTEVVQTLQSISAHHVPVRRVTAA
jgi:CBS domain-containing protein